MAMVILIKNLVLSLARRQGNGKPTSSNKESPVKRYVRCDQGNYTKVQTRCVSSSRIYCRMLSSKPKRDESNLAV